MGHKQTSGYHKTRVLNKIRLFDRFQSKESELDRFEKLGSYAALLTPRLTPRFNFLTDTHTHTHTFRLFK